MNFDIKIFLADQINKICESRKLNVKELSTAVGLPYSSFNTYANGTTEPKASFFLAMFNYGVNIHWLLTGEGSMFRDGEHSPQAQAQDSLLLCQWIEHYAATRTKAELSWLEVEIARQYPEFNAWLIEQGHEPLAKPDWFDRFLVSPLFKTLSPAARSEIAEMVEAAAQQGKKNP